MRGHPLRGLRAAAAVAACAAVLAHAPPPGAGQDAPVLELVPPAELREGDRTGVVALVRLPGDEPFLLTPTGEGTAVEVVRGRLLRSDAEDPEARPLRLRIPIVARAPGDSVVRVHLRGFACEERCRPVDVEAEVALHVRARRGD